MTDSPYLTSDEAAAIIRSTPDYVARQCSRRAIVAKKIGNEWRIHREDLDRFMRAGGKAPATRNRRRKAVA